MRLAPLLALMLGLGFGGYHAARAQSAGIPISLTVEDPPPSCRVSGSVHALLFGTIHRPFRGRPDRRNIASRRDGQFTVTASHSTEVCGWASTTDALSSGGNSLAVTISFSIDGGESGTVERDDVDYGGCFTPSDGGGLFTSTDMTVFLEGYIDRVTSTTPLGRYTASLSIGVGCG